MPTFDSSNKENRVAKCDGIWAQEFSNYQSKPTFPAKIITFYHLNFLSLKNPKDHKIHSNAIILFEVLK